MSSSTRHSRHSRRHHNSSSTSNTNSSAPPTVKLLIQSAARMPASSAAGIALTAVLEKDSRRVLTFPRIIGIAALFATCQRSRKLRPEHIEYAVKAILIDDPRESVRISNLLERDLAEI